jgi:hypothetical protein
MRFFIRLRGWFWGLLLVLAGGRLAAQSAPLPCLLLPLSPAERVQAASLIVEAEVLDAQGEWGAAHQHIFTRQRLRVFRVLKGALPDTAALALLVEGGQVGLARQELTNTLRPLPVGQQGIFFLRPGPGLRGLRLQPGRYHLQPGPGHRRRARPPLRQLGRSRSANRTAQRPARSVAAP